MGFSSESDASPQPQLTSDYQMMEMSSFRPYDHPADWLAAGKQLAIWRVLEQRNINVSHSLLSQIRSCEYRDLDDLLIRALEVDSAEELFP